ncbi:MAG: hypothetical protein H7X83_00580 [Verrucomicrobia bacterium]|nr:hypothetical protein [Deltaproteobacteria bacterium]
MSQIEVERFLGRLITDADFRARAACSLEKAASKEGVNLSREEMLLLAGIDYALFGRVAETLDDSIRRT